MPLAARMLLGPGINATMEKANLIYHKSGAPPLMSWLRTSNQPAS